MTHPTNNILSAAERTVSIARMRAAVRDFYTAATQTNCHPFIEFTGLMKEYIDCCEQAHNDGIDFTACNAHSGQELPMKAYQVGYVNEKLECIFTGRSVMNKEGSAT